MKYKEQYFSDEERQSKLDANTDKILIEEQNLFEGNFLIFSDDVETDTATITYVEVPQTEFESLKTQVAQLTIQLGDLLLGGM